MDSNVRSCAGDGFDVSPGMNAAATDSFRYMTGYKIECIRACGKTLACCTLPRLFIWNLCTKELVHEIKKTVRITSIVFWNSEPFFVSSRALHDKKLQTVTDLEFLSAILVVENSLVAVGKKYFTVFSGEEITRKEHGLDYGVCTRAILVGKLVYASFENGKLVRISNVLGETKVSELVYVKEPITSIQLFLESIAACTLDSKLLLVDPSTGNFVFTRVKGELRKVISIGPYILLLDCRERLMVFDSSLSFAGILSECVVDVDVEEDLLFVATTRRQIMQYDLSNRLTWLPNERLSPSS
eukprot:jgi/Antlo1/2267/1413